MKVRASHCQQIIDLACLVVSAHLTETIRDCVTLARFDTNS